MKCEDCPVATGSVCLGESHGPICIQKRADPRRVDQLRALAEGTTAAIDPIAGAIDLCDLRASCQCREPIACMLGGWPGEVTLGQCRACQAAFLDVTPDA